MYIYTSSGGDENVCVIELMCFWCAHSELVPLGAYDQRPKVCPKCGGKWERDVKVPPTTTILRKQGVPI